MKIEDLRLTDDEAFKVSRPVEGYPGLITECDRVRMDAATLKAARMALRWVTNLESESGWNGETREYDDYVSLSAIRAKLAELEDEG